MITSYLPIHNEEQYEGQYDFERARAGQVRRIAELHGVKVRLKHDGDTSYLEAHVRLTTLGTATGEGEDTLDRDDEELWSKHVTFLIALEDSNLGYLLHEVDTEAEKRLVEELIDIGDDSPRALACSLKYVDVDYRRA